MIVSVPSRGLGLINGRHVNLTADRVTEFPSPRGGGANQLSCARLSLRRISPRFRPLAGVGANQRVSGDNFATFTVFPSPRGGWS